MKTFFRLSLSLITSTAVLQVLIQSAFLGNPLHRILLFAIVFFITFLTISKLFVFYIFKTINNLASLCIEDVVFGLAGMLLGSLPAFLFAAIAAPFGYIIRLASLLLLVVCAYAGSHLAIYKRADFIALFGKSSSHANLRNKILDTSAIIDGRILDILKTNFIEGIIIVPDFILQELRGIADSSDNIKRTRGRLGLDVLNNIKELDVEVDFLSWDKYTELEVDMRLLKLAEELDAYIITTDYNLNKIAEFHCVPTLNVNDLTNAVKTVVLPGQDINVNVIKDGKEVGQGVAYLSDGTMIVVEDGRRFIGDNVNVTVTSVLQTSAGRMIFAKPV